MNSWNTVERAEQNLLEIYLYGLRQFGRNQSAGYIREPEHVFGLLADHPRMGRVAPDLGRNIRRHEHKSHVILYEESEAGVTILAVIHSSAVRGLTL